MELYFYSKSSKPYGKGVKCNYAQIVLDEERRETFLETVMKLCGATIFQSRHLENNYCETKSGKEISEIVKRYGVHAILETDVCFIKKVINNMEGVVDWGILTISDWEKLHYAVIFQNNLLIAYDK